MSNNFAYTLRKFSCIHTRSIHVSTGQRIPLMKKEKYRPARIFQFTTKLMWFVTRKVCVTPEAHAAAAYPSFYDMKRIEVFLLPLDGMLVHYIIPPPPYSQQHYICLYPRLYPFIHLSGGTVRVKCLAQKRNTMNPGQGSNPGHSIRIPAR